MNADGSNVRLREDIARLILAERVECLVHPPGLPKPSCWQCGRNGAFTRAARIALGRHTGWVDVGKDRGSRPVRVRWRDLRRALVVRRPAAETPVADIAVFLTGVSDGAASTERLVAAELGLPSGTVLTAADQDALVTRFTAHARVLIANGMCPVHETPLLITLAGRQLVAGECAACGRSWYLGAAVAPYVIDGSRVTGGEPR